jgi:tetratricopeptide (TPR) repeat protein
MKRSCRVLVPLAVVLLTAGSATFAQQPPPTGGGPYLGITVHPVDHALARQLGVTARQGAVITRTAAGGPGERAGLRPGDVIVKFGNTPITTVGQLESLAGRLTIGNRYRVEFYRGRNFHFVDLAVTRRPDPGVGMSPVPPPPGPAPGGRTPIGPSPIGQSPVAQPPAVQNDRTLTVRRKLFSEGPGGNFQATVTVAGLTGAFPQSSPEMFYYQFRWLPGKPEIADVEADFPVRGAALGNDPAEYLLVSGYQADGRPVTVRVTCPQRPELEDGGRAGDGTRYRILGCRTEVLQFAGHDAPGLYSIDITAPQPGTFTWTPRKFDTQPHVCGPQVVGVYAIYRIERQTYEGDRPVEKTIFDKPYRVAWLLLGCPGDKVEKDNRLYVMGAAGTTEAAADAAASGPQRWYRHVEGAYRLGLPAGWSVVEHYRGDIRDPQFDTLYNPDRTLKVICYRGHENAEEPDKSLEKYTREKLASDKGAVLERFALHTMPAVRISYPLTGGKGHASRVSFVREGRRYVINAVIQDNADTRRLDPRLAAVLKTLQMKRMDPRADTLGEESAAPPEKPAAEPAAASGPADAITAEPLPDEARAMAAVKSSPTPENTAALAKIRARHAFELLELARKKREDGLFRLALRYGLSATELAPQEAIYWFLVAQICDENRGQPLADRLTLEAAQEALALAPNDNRIRLFLGQAQFRQGLLDAALGNFEQAITREPKLLVPSLVGMMTLAYIQDMQTARGRDFLTKLLTEQPEADCARLALAILLHHDGKEEEAAAEARRVADSPRASPENRAYARELPVLWEKEKSL